MSVSKKQEIFGAALEIEDEAERRALLDSACAGDRQLRGQIEELLGTSAQAEGFFEECATAIIASKEEIDPSLQINGAQRAGSLGNLVGSNIGCYKLLEVMGEGGCGVVYMAEQEK